MAGSFFTSLQGWVKRELGSDYAGRYFGQLVAQVARIDPAPFRQFFWTETKNGAFRSRRMRIELEVEFLVGRRRRRSDLVVYLDDEPKLLVELKYRDSPSERHAVGSRQLDDYLALCRELASKPRFLLMHKEIQDDCKQTGDCYPAATSICVKGSQAVSAWYSYRKAAIALR